MARHPDRHGADLRSHLGRVRGGADGRRQHSRRDQDHRHFNLRSRSSFRRCRRGTDGGAAAFDFDLWPSLSATRSPSALAGAMRDVPSTQAGLAVNAPPGKPHPARCRAVRRTRRDPGAGRSVGQRQIDDAAGHRRPLYAVRRAGRVQWIGLARPRSRHQRAGASSAGSAWCSSPTRSFRI